MSATLSLPYPPSANRYWRTRVIKGVAVTYVSDEAKNYKTGVAWLAKSAGIRKPYTGRVSVDIALYPHRPQDWAKRAKQNPPTWDDTVQCIDIDNARKVLYDALQGVAFVNDKFIFQDSGRRMEPDEHGARVVVTIAQIVAGQRVEVAA